MQRDAWIQAGGLLLILVAGCAWFDPPPARMTAPPTQAESRPERSEAPVNLTGFTASFKEGYADGCESAGARSQRRYEERYKTEADYMRGWNDGFSACQRRR